MDKLIIKVKEMELTPREQFMFGLILFLGGLLLGFILSPKGERSYGCNNGNNNTGCLQNNDQPCDGDENADNEDC